MAHINSGSDKKGSGPRASNRGQIEGIERAIAEGTGCYAVLQQTAAARGALNGLMAELIDGHVRNHVVVAALKTETGAQEKSVEKFMDIVHSYLR